jgi:hypothetical protein
MSYYKFGDTWKWFMGRVSDINDPEKLGRVKVRIIHEQTGDLGRKIKTYGIKDEDLLWAWPMSAINSSSLSWRKIEELEEFKVPEWIRAVGLSPVGIAVSTYVFGFYLDGKEQNIPVIMGTYHKKSRFPEPPTDETTGKFLQIKPPEETKNIDSDLSSLARGDDQYIEKTKGMTLPKQPYQTTNLWGDKVTVNEHPSSYSTTYPYNLTYTTKSGHAIELDDTPGHERIHIWHTSGSYEEIANGPFKETGLKDYPEWPDKYQYKTAGDVIENDYKGRRVQRTTDSKFEVVVKDKNQQLRRDHNGEVANTETWRIGNNMHWTVGYKSPPPKRDNPGGELGSFNTFFDTSNNHIVTTGNNHLESVGYATTNRDLPGSKNRYVDVANNEIIRIAKNQTVDIGENCTVTIGKNCKVTIAGTCDIHSDGAMNITSGTSITLEAPRIDLNP